MSTQSWKFIANGLVATAVNYCVLAFLVDVIELSHIWMAGFVAAIAGISASFIGNRHFVFRSTAPIVGELLRFKTLYAVTALFQVIFLALWSDVLALDYRLGFILVTGLSVFISYHGNRILVFR
ncbi:MAG: GtrA family protein [Candidatus Parabeggiatoa sp.]|nr:GtrA family protein [Candidatus Parabeggiatoa sp.]